MKVTVKFLGGAQTVTGSRYLLTIDDFRILVDCGLFQGLKEYRTRNWEDFPIDPGTIQAIILTHAHIDHTGYLPKLVKEGYNGNIYCTFPTEELVRILLLDSAKLQEEEAAYAQRKGYSKHEKPQALYTKDDAEKVFPMLYPIDFNTETHITDQVKFTFFNAGHILGASIVKLKLIGSGQKKIIVFSGDLGRFHDPLMNPPTRIPSADILFLESTYGDRKSGSIKPENDLALAIRETYNNGGVSVIPAFAVGRTQLLLYYLHLLQSKGKIPDLPIYVDSPMAIDVTKLYKKYPTGHRLGPFLDEPGKNPFSHSKLNYYQSQESSISLNAIRGDAIILSASGMATGGRILHHLYNRLPNEQDSIIFVGYQAEGTRGSKLLAGDKTCRIYGLEIPVLSKVYYIEGLSAHADQDELLEWADGFTSKPKMTFLVHGEKKASEVLQQLISEELGWNVIVPTYLESFVLFDGL